MRVLLASLALAAPSLALAQHDHGVVAPATNASPTVGSGTAWLPAAAPLRGFHGRAGGWALMVHGSVFAQLVRTFGTRRDYQFGSVNWIMGEASRPLAGGTFGVRAMASAEALTVTGRGYPQLLQVAQPYHDEMLADRMHPHEVISEAAVTYERPLGGRVRGFLYLAAVGEPALGPVAYMHRPSALNDPAAPLGHHAQDVTHESFGVVTVGLFSRRVRLEASVFNGAHPDEDRTNLEYSGARLDSYSTRITVNPTVNWSISTSTGYMAATQGAHGHGALRRFSVAVLHSTPLGRGGDWSSALIWGANMPTDTRRLLQSVLVESNYEPDDRQALSGRAEYVTRTAEELNLVGSVNDELGVTALSLGYARRVAAWRGVTARLGVKATVHRIPEELRLFYGTRTPVSVVAYVVVRPPRLRER